MSALRPIRGCRALPFRAPVRHASGRSRSLVERCALRRRNLPAEERFGRAAGRHDYSRRPDSSCMRGIGLGQCRVGRRVRGLRTMRAVAREGRRDAPGIFPSLRKEVDEVPLGRAFPRFASLRKPRLPANRSAARSLRSGGTDWASGHPARESRFVTPSRGEGGPNGPKTPRASAAGRPAGGTGATNAGRIEACESARGRVLGMRKAGAGFVRGRTPLLGRARAVSAALPTGLQELERS